MEDVQEVGEELVAVLLGVEREFAIPAEEGAKEILGFDPLLASPQLGKQPGIGEGELAFAREGVFGVEFGLVDFRVKVIREWLGVRKALESLGVVRLDTELR